MRNLTLPILCLGLLLVVARSSGSELTWCGAQAPIGAQISQPLVEARVVLVAFPDDGENPALPPWVDALCHQSRVR
jgi:hypothetical protein